MSAPKVRAGADLDPSTWWLGYEAAAAKLDLLPGPLVAVVAAQLLRVTPDPLDDPAFDAGFRAALSAALP